MLTIEIMAECLANIQPSAIGDAQITLCLRRVISLVFPISQDVCSFKNILLLSYTFGCM